MEMKRVAIGELEGVALDWAVAVAVCPDSFRDSCRDDGLPHWSEGWLRNGSPSTDWSQCGPLIERYGITVRPHCTANDLVTSWAADYVWPVTRDCPGHCGKTPLIAACRAIVASHNPDGYVEVPVELLEDGHES